MQKELAIIILNWNGTNDTIECIKSLYENIGVYDIYILDNASQNEQIEFLENYLSGLKGFHSPLMEDAFCELNNPIEGISLIKSHVNLGFAVGNNFIAKVIFKWYRYILLLNNDTIVPNNSIVDMLSAIKTQTPTALTCDIRYESERSVLWNAGGKFKWYGDRRYYSQKKIDKLIAKGVKYINAEFITGCALMVDSNYIAKNGLLTNKFFHGEEDYNFCLNLKKRKLPVGVDLGVRIFHKVGRSIGRNQTSTQQLRSNVVHYTNRVIDYKDFYSNIRWRIWRKFYLFLISMKRRIAGMSARQAKIIKKKVLYYSDRYDNVQRDVFTQIMNDEEII